jgi:hypothetical protein
MAEAAVTAPPSPEDRQRAIDILAAQMVKGGVSEADAEDAAATMIDSAILVRQGEATGEGEVGSDQSG